MRRADRLFWVLLSRLWPAWREALVIVKPETVIAWHRKGIRWLWTWKSRRRKGGRPPVPREVRELIRRMSRENPLWGAPRAPLRRRSRMAALSKGKPARTAPRWSFQERQDFYSSRSTHPEARIDDLSFPGGGFADVLSFAFPYSSASDPRLLRRRACTLVWLLCGQSKLQPPIIRNVAL